jgi:hypothetical protein
MVETAEAWFLGLEEAIVSLEELPNAAHNFRGSRCIVNPSTARRGTAIASCTVCSKRVEQFSLSMSAMARAAAPDCNFEAIPPT